MSLKLRTEIETPKTAFKIDHRDKLLMLGSCFTDNIGARLERDGFEVIHNPLGPLYNPMSLARVIEDIEADRVYEAKDFTADTEGVEHCLDFASRYQDRNGERLAEMLNKDFGRLKRAYAEATTVIVTFGTSVIYTLDGRTETVVGNCHKFPAAMFERKTVEPSEMAARWQALLARMKDSGKRVILTVSPIRHLGDGLHGNTLSKARLLLCCEMLKASADYFPAYEIMMDDLRDYRFYERDLKHPTEVACDYIYEKFGESYFGKETQAEAEMRRKESLRSVHRQIIDKRV